MTALAQAARPAEARSSLVVDALLILLASGLVAASAQLSIRLPFTPVPISGQTLAVLLVGATLGAVRGASALLLYLAEGAAGLPVFAEGKSGILYLTSADPLHATGGYLWGFVAAAFVVGFLAERGWDRTIASAMGAMLVGNIVIYLFGIPWVAAAVGVSGEKALGLGLYPFVVGDIVKLLVAAAALPAAWRFVGSERSG